MNWNRGLRRIIFVLSIFGSIFGVIYSLHIVDSCERMAGARLELWRARLSKPDPLDMIYQWSTCRSFQEQKELWKVWTGEELLTNRDMFERVWSEQADSAKEVAELERLRKIGWKRWNGDLLPYIPDKVLEKNEEWLQELQTNLSKLDLLYVPAAAFGGAIGFSGIWLVYALIRWLVLGFCSYERADKQKQ